MKNKEFWEKKEKELQEKIIHKCMVQYIKGCDKVSGQLWSLFFYSKQAIYLMMFPEKDILRSIFPLGKKSDQQSFDLRIPWNDITRISFPEEKSKLRKYFSRSSNLVTVDYLLHQKNISLDLYFTDSVDTLKKFIALVNKKLLD